MLVYSDGYDNLCASGHYGTSRIPAHCSMATALTLLRWSNGQAYCRRCDSLWDFRPLDPAPFKSLFNQESVTFELAISAKHQLKSCWFVLTGQNLVL